MNTVLEQVLKVQRVPSHRLSSATAGLAALPEQVMFVDLGWGGEAGTTCYPPFVNPSVPRAILDADGKPVEQWHDAWQLKDTIMRQSGRQCCRSRPPVGGTRRHKCQTRLPPSASLLRMGRFRPNLHILV